MNTTPIAERTATVQITVPDACGWPVEFRVTATADRIVDVRRGRSTLPCTREDFWRFREFLQNVPDGDAACWGAIAAGLDGHPISLNLCAEAA